MAMSNKGKRKYSEVTASDDAQRNMLEASHRSLEKKFDEKLALTVASIETHMGNYKAAEPLYRRILTSSEETLGKDHMNTVRTVHMLAFVLAKSSENYKEAELLYKRALQGHEAQVGGYWGVEAMRREVRRHKER